MRERKIRFLYMVLVGIGVSFLLDTMKIGAVDQQHKQFFDFLISIVITIVVWEGNLRIDSLMDKRFPWEKNPGTRVAAQVPVSVVFSASIIYVSMLAFNALVCQFPEHTKDRFIVVALVVGVLVSILLLAVEVGSQFFSKWKRSLVEIEKYKAESLQAQLQNLKDQINPHFLFNNMSVLSALVYTDPNKAVDFINQLSRVYRYLLDSRGSELVSLQDELTFIHSYTYLLKIRFDKSLNFQFTIDKHMESALLPPMSVQILVENAIKHNEVSSELPLFIDIRTEDDVLKISNNLQLRKVSEQSSKTGIKNIRDRYSFFTARLVKIEETNGSFSVSLPLLRSA